MIWSRLETELSIWTREGLDLPIWWRDDDAIAPTAQLDRLERAGEIANLPVHLAIIPAEMTPELPPHVAQSDWLLPVVHGWRHKNHQPANEKKAEFGTGNRQAADDAVQGFVTLRNVFGNDLVPMFVPPWNRISEAALASLPTAGAQVLSTYGPRKAEQAAPGLLQVNTHVDPVDWRGSRGLADPEILLLKLIDHLENRRHGRADNHEPLGLLTHHLMQDDETWAFCIDLLAILNAHGARPAAPTGG